MILTLTRMVRVGYVVGKAMLPKFVLTYNIKVNTFAMFSILAIAAKTGEHG